MTVFTAVLFLHLAAAFALFIGSGIEWITSSFFRSASFLFLFFCCSMSHSHAKPMVTITMAMKMAYSIIGTSLSYLTNKVHRPRLRFRISLDVF